MTVRRLVAGLVLASALPLLAACKDDGPSGVAYDIAIHAGDGQSGAAGSVLALPLAVLIKDPSGAPVRGAVAVFRPTAGSGVTLFDSLATTGVDGIARVDVRLGGQTTATAAPIATASVRGSSRRVAVTFSAKTTPGPTLTQVSKTTLQAGDVVTLTGTNFNTTSTGNDVRIGSSRALITRASETSLDVVVPPCVAAGSVGVRVIVGTASTNTLNVTYTSTAYTASLAVYQGITVSGTELGNCLRLPANGAAYLVVPQYATDALPLTLNGYVIGSTAAAAATASATLDVAAREDARTAQSRLDFALRAAERTIPEASLLRGGSAMRTFEAEVLNSTRQFSVLCSLSTSCFKTVTAALKFIGDNLLIYVDQTVPAADAFTDTELSQLGRVFDKDLYPIDVAVFGPESDIDGNSKVIMLLTPVVNQLAPAATCQSEGYVLGFFYGYDLTQERSSNKGEVFYGLTPDSQGQFSCAHSKADVMSRLPSTFIHEFQHMISYNQHRLVRAGSQETDWLNEGLSHIAEELGSRYYEARYPPPTGRRTTGQVFPDSSQGFILEDLANAYDYLVAPAAHSVTLFDTRDCCESRGSAWLFLRWLGDQRDSTIYTRLVQTNKTGVANVENATGETFGKLFGDFGIAAYTDSLPGVPRTSIPPQYRFTSRNLRYLFAALNRTFPGSFPRTFPLVTTSLPYDASLNQAMVPGTSAYYELATPSGAGTAALRFAPQSGTFDSRAGAQVGIFRLR